jgi:hypothetical protein
VANYLKVAGLAAVLAVVAFVSAGQGQPPPKDVPRVTHLKWEYKFHVRPLFAVGAGLPHYDGRDSL